MLTTVMKNPIANILQNSKEQNKKIICEIMNSLGIDSINLEFDGSGDSGQVESVTVSPEHLQDAFEEIKTKGSRVNHYWSENTWHADLVEHECSASDLAMDVAYEILENKYGGWEINEGSFGTIIINADGSGRIEYNQRVETTEYEESNF